NASHTQDIVEVAQRDVRPRQGGAPPIRAFKPTLFYAASYQPRFGSRERSAVAGNNVAGMILGPEGLALPLRVVFYDGTRHAQNVLRRAVILLEFDRSRSWKVFLEIQYVSYIRPAKLVNGLVLVSNDEDIPV